MEKKFLLAVVISVLVLTLYPYIINKFYPSQKTAFQNQPFVNTIPPEQIKTSMEMPKGIEPQEKEVELENSLIKIEFSNINAAINKVYLKNVPGLEEELLLLDTGRRKNKPFSLSLDITPYKKTSYNFVKGPDNIFFSSLADNKIFIEKSFLLAREGPILKVNLRLTNKSDSERVFTYGIIGQTTLKSEIKQDERLLEFDIKSNNTVLREPAFRLKQPRVYKGEFLWVSSKNRYFCFAIKPSLKAKEVSLDKEDNDLIYLGLSDGELTLKPQEAIEVSYLVYIGPLRLSELKRYGLNEILNFGIFDPIGRLLLGLLGGFYRFTGNYGIAIILLTIFTSIALFPLSLKSIKSMKQMQVLQPQIEKLRKECKDNPHKLNKEIMELYKRHKVNPFGGCLPMLLQMPIFIALYQVISRSIELKGAGFLWAKDLSIPDRLKIPFILPLIGDHINLFPILMIVAMFLQQKIANPMAKTQDEQTRTLSVMMPIMFGVIFYNLPSALVLYWLTNTVFMSLLQYIVLRPALAKE